MKTGYGYGYIVEYVRSDGKVQLGRVTAESIWPALDAVKARLPGVQKVLRVNRIWSRPEPIDPEETVRVRTRATTYQIL